MSVLKKGDIVTWHLEFPNIDLVGVVVQNLGRVCLIADVNDATNEKYRAYTESLKKIDDIKK